MKKIIPQEHEYPFGVGGVIISKYQPIKFVMSYKEVEAVFPSKISKLMNKNMLEIYGQWLYIPMVQIMVFYSGWNGQISQNKHFVF